MKHLLILACAGSAISLAAPQQARPEPLRAGGDQAAIDRLQETATWWYAQAPAYAEKCPLFEVNTSRAEEFLGEFKIDITDFDKGHKYRDLFVKELLRARVYFSEYSEVEACAQANKFYGTNGFLVKSLLKEKD